MPTLKEAKDKVREFSQKGLDVFADTGLTAAEMKSKSDAIDVEIKKWMDEVSSLESIEERRKQFLGAVGSPVEDAGADQGQQAGVAKSIGQQFVESGGYKAFKNLSSKSSSWSTGAVELKTLLAEGTAGTPGNGYAPVQTPTVLPGIIDIRFQPLTIESLFPGGATDTPLIRYLVESAVTNAAAATAEGALKPESALSFTKVDETLHKIATFLPVTDEMLEDFEQIQSYIDNRLKLFVQIATETQLLKGDGTGSNLVGILNRTGLATTIAKGTAPSVSGDNDMDAILRQITAIRTTAFLEPDAIVLNPLDWQTILLTKATGTGVYFAGGPFVSAENQTLWGKRVVATNAMTAGTALVGSFGQGGQVFTKGGLTVEASNSHADFFQRNQTAIRAERRLALAIFRPGAFGTVSNL
jgi:HK97 family phage major capsid protein